MAYNPSLKVKSLFGKDKDDDTTEYQNKMTSAFGNNQNQNTNKFLYAPNNVNNLLGNTNDTDESKTNATDTVKKGTVAFKTIELKRPSSEFSKKTNQKLGKVSERAKSELERLSRDGNQILPKYDDYESIKIGNKTVTMKASVAKYKSISKTIASKTVNTLLSTSQYQKANEKTKVSMINKVYELSSELAKAQLMKSYKLDGESAIFVQTAKNYGNLPEFVIRQFA